MSSSVASNQKLKTHVNNASSPIKKVEAEANSEYNNLLVGTTMETVLKKLTSLQTVSGSYEANDHALDYVANYLSERGMRVKQFDLNGHQSLVASTRRDNDKQPIVLLGAHMDVVPAPEELFRLREENGKFFGRGVFDMKFAIAVYLQLVDDLEDRLAEYDFGIMVTSDEELGGHYGTSALIEKGYKPTVVVLPDAGDSPDAWKFERSAKGIWHAKVSTPGRSAHASRPWKAKNENAAVKLMHLLNDIQALFENQGPKTNTANITIIKGGKAINQIPDNASAVIDIRTLSDNDYEAIHNQIALLCEKYDAELTDVLPYGNACNTDFNNPYVDQFVSCLKKAVKDTKIDVTESYGASDARFFAKSGIPCIVVSPPGDGFHAPDEWVSKEGVYQLRDALYNYLEKVAHKPASDLQPFPNKVDSPTVKL